MTTTSTNDIALAIQTVATLATAATAVFTWRAATAARNSASAAKRSADTSQRTLEVSERPWLGVTNVGVKIERGERPHFLVGLKNFGSLPAALTRHRINSCLTSEAPPDDPLFVSGMSDAGILNPNEERQLEWPSEFAGASAEWDRWRTGAGTRLFVWFEIYYNDPLAKEHCFAGILGADGDKKFRWWPNASRYIRST